MRSRFAPSPSVRSSRTLLAALLWWLDGRDGYELLVAGKYDQQRCRPEHMRDLRQTSLVWYRLGY